MTSTHDRLAGVLEDLGAQLPAIRRRRVNGEAPLELTNAYAAFLFAAGFARLGRRERARGLAGEAERDLRAWIAATPAYAPRFDAVHACLVAAFSARVEQALARRPRHVPLPAPVIKQLNALSFIERYKVDRLREALPALETERVDPIGEASRRQQTRVAASPGVVKLLAIDEPAARAARIEALLARAAESDPAPREALLAACFDAMLDLGESDGISLLVQAMPLVTRLSPELHAQALAVAARYGWGELVPALVASLRARLAEEPPEVLSRGLSPCLRALRGLGLRDELAALLAVAEARVGRAELGPALHVGDPTAPPAHRDLRLVLAGGLALLGDPRGPALLDAAHALLEQTTHSMRRLELIRELTWGAAHGPVEPALAGMAQLAPGFERVTDSFGTNSHFCNSALHFIDSLVHGITGLADDDPRTAAAPPAPGAPVT